MSDAGLAPSSWILLRGLTREQRHWGTFAHTFTAQMPSAQVIAIDLPGNGELHRERSPAHVEAMAEHCREQLRRRGLRPPHHVLAMSLGAMVATAWATAHPHELAGAVLINTSLRPFSPIHHRLRPRNVGTLLRLLLTQPNPLDWERAVLRLTSNAPAPDDALLEAWAAYHCEHPVTAANALRQLWAATRYRAPRARPSPPVLLLTSARDGLVDTRCSQALAHQWQCPIAVHPAAGHDLPLDDAPWVAAQVRVWLQRLAGDATGTPPAAS